ncbi:MAG: ANTAR domain-containing protein [Desulforudis sp.]|nr:ANTAR domain-containing protein [Clostridia bacterium]MDQ7791339.1 ANTAR domain-containing protein [Clostridia bacterium]RJX20655.1 MAG: ANTAR domain-containing protein [Desulforudis sp.]
MPRQQRVVLVDENNVWRKNIKAMLTKADLMVIGEAEDGITGLKLIRARQPDIVLIEAMLPGMTGLELASIVHGDKLAPVIMMCNAYYQDLLAKAVSAHVYGFLVKPVDEHQLIASVEVATARYAEIVNIEDEIRQLKDKLETRKILEKAKGILMNTLGLNEAEAFRRIQKQSMNRRISMRAVAEAIILTHNM